VINALGAPQSLLLLGGTSDIGLALAEALIRDRCTRVVLAARPTPRRDAARDRLTGAGAGTSTGAGEGTSAGDGAGVRVETVDFDARDTAGHAATLKGAFDGGDLDLAVLAFGLLGDQERAEHDPAHALDIVETNYLGGVSTLAHLTQRMRDQGHGTIVVLSSFAARRPRRANYTYGSAKAGLDAYATGLGDALHGTGLRVVVVRPGFVSTKMTEHLKPAPLATTPQAVADAIIRGIRTGKDVIWAPAPVQLISAALAHLPRPLFRRLPL
jgi:decaprenylphospho-beta-D-erythro-pentofuranosid-2-ulose 2-reductase